MPDATRACPMVAEPLSQEELQESQDARRRDWGWEGLERPAPESIRCCMQSLVDVLTSPKRGCAED
eukprot:10707815-Alexandrium_andersonii.AAC.1